MGDRFTAMGQDHDSCSAVAPVPSPAALLATFAFFFFCLLTSFLRLFSPAVALRFRSRRCVASALLPLLVR